MDNSTLRQIVVSACAVALCACSSENGGNDSPSTPPTPPEPAQKLPIRISSEPETRATDIAFETGDRIGVFVVNRNADGSAASARQTAVAQRTAASVEQTRNLTIPARLPIAIIP